MRPVDERQHAAQAAYDRYGTRSFHGPPGALACTLSPVVRINKHRAFTAPMLDDGMFLLPDRRTAPTFSHAARVQFGHFMLSLWLGAEAPTDAVRPPSRSLALAGPQMARRAMGGDHDVMAAGFPFLGDRGDCNSHARMRATRVGANRDAHPGFLRHLGASHLA